MSYIHYLRELSLIKKRITLYADELQHMQDSTLTKRNDNTDKDLLIKMLNELRTLKMSSIIRYRQQYSLMHSQQQGLAKKFLLRTLKERYFLQQIDREIQKFGGRSEFRPVIHATSTIEENYPITSCEKVLRENAAAHSIMVECYKQFIGCLRYINKEANLEWLLKSMALVQQKYNRNDHLYLENIAA